MQDLSAFFKNKTKQNQQSSAFGRSPFPNETNIAKILPRQQWPGKGLQKSEVCSAQGSMRGLSSFSETQAMEFLWFPMRD